MASEPPWTDVPPRGDALDRPAAPNLEALTADHAAADADQTAADADQTAADSDQTAADSDQSIADDEQAQADTDQDASERDQATADRDEAGQDSHDPATKDAYDASRADRKATGLARNVTALHRARTARDRAVGEAERDKTAEQRDLRADARDRAAQVRDDAAAEAEKHLVPRDRSAKAILRYAARVRKEATASRIRAADDRKRAAADRTQAAIDRAQAGHDREIVLAELREAHLDDLTGAYLRPAGLAAVQQEIERARRANGRLVLAFIDVDRLKQVNDSLGHHAGDELLRAVVIALRARMRSYEPIVRFGGDEFLCAVPDIDIAAARVRFDSVKTALNEDGKGGTISFGLAALEPEDRLDDLINRADCELRKVRAKRA